MKATTLALTVAALFALASPSLAQTQGSSFAFGGDQYMAGQDVSVASPVEHDAFAAGYNVTLTAPVAGTAHLAGFNVNANAAVTGDLYAGGFSLRVAAPIGGDVTAFGNSVALGSGASVAGNGRLAGASVSIDAPVQGSALVSARTLSLSNTVGGDLSFYGETITFGSGAKVTGKFLIQAPKPIDVPASVASPSQITYQELVIPDYATETGRTAESVVKGFWPQFWIALSWFLLLFVIGAMLIAFAPATLALLSTASTQRPFRKLGRSAFAARLTHGCDIDCAYSSS